MGQEQLKTDAGGKRQEKEKPQEKDRAVVGNFQFNDKMQVNPATGTGKKENPGRPT